MRKWTINMRAGVCFHASGVREDQFVPIDVVLPSTREANGGGGCDESGASGAR